MNAKDLEQKLKAIKDAALAVCDVAAREGRQLTADEKAKVEGFTQEGEQIKAHLAGLRSDQELRDMVGKMGAGLEGAGDSPGKAVRGRSIGEQFVKAEGFQSWLKQVAPGGALSVSERVMASPTLSIKTGELFGFKALVTSGSESGGAFVTADRTNIVDLPDRRPLTLLDLLTTLTTEQQVVEFVRRTQAAAQAAPTLEANVTTYSGATGEISGEKPEASQAYEVGQTPVRTIPVWIPATRQTLSDVPQLRQMIDVDLRDDVKEELEDQCLTGNGVGANLTGLFYTAGHLVQGWDTDVLTTFRKAITTVGLYGRVFPTAMLVHPIDAESLDLTRDLNGQFYFGGPYRIGSTPVWGVPVVQNTGVPQGTGLLGDFGKARLYMREDATIRVSDSHADFFIRNMIAILCELRAALAVIRPQAFIEVPFESGS